MDALKKKKIFEKKFKVRRIATYVAIGLLGAGVVASNGCLIYFALNNVKTCNVNLHLDGGVVSGGETQKVIKGSMVGQIPTPFKSNFVFNEWHDAKGAVVSSNTIINTNIELYAHYISGGHKVTFNLDGGTIPGLTETYISVMDKTKIGTLPSPVKDNYMFDHWNDSNGNPIDPTTEIKSDISVYATYKTVSARTVSGGTTLLEFKSDVAGKDTKAWKLYNADTEIQGAAWELTDAPAGLTIDSDGIINWNNVAAGKYKVIVTGTKGDISASAEINIVSTAPIYTLSSGSPILNVKSEGTFSDDKSWSMYKDASVLGSGVEWSVTKPASLTSATVTITNGKISCSDIPHGTFELTVTGKQTSTGETAETKVQLVSTDYAHSISGGSTVLNFKSDETDGKDANAWKMYQETTQYTSGVTWSVENNPTGLGIGTDGKITWNNVTAGTYNVKVVGTNGTFKASSEISVNVVNPIYSIAGGSTLIEVDSQSTKSDTKAWKMSKDGTALTSGVTWSLSASPTTDAITIGETTGIITATKLPKGTYTVTVTGTQTSTGKTATAQVSVVSKDLAYSISGGTTELVIKSNATGTDTGKPWKLYNGTTEITDATWTLTGAPTGLSINSSTGIVSWTNVAACSKTVTVTGTKGDVTASATILVNSTDTVYKIAGGSSLFEVRSEGTFTDTAWVMSKDGTALTSGVTWSVSPTTTGISITNDGKLTATDLSRGTYKLTITGKETATNATATAEVSVVSTDYVYSIADGRSSLTINDNDAKTDTEAFTMWKDSTKITSTITWSVASTPSLATTKLSISADGKLIYSNIPAGTYDLLITGSISGHSATAKCTLISQSTHIVGINITGDDSITTSKSATYTAVVVPSTGTKNLTWSIDSWSGGTTYKPTIGATTGVVTTTAGDTTDAEGTLKIKVTDSVSGLSATKEISIKNPWRESNGVWAYMGSGTNAKWYQLTMSDLADSTKSTIGRTDLSGTADTTSRTDFNNSIVIGEKVHSIPDNFLDSCAKFNSTITFGGNSELLIVGSYFLSGCSIFNKELVLPNTVQIIGEDFLADCSAFNNGGTKTTFAMPTSLTSIGDEFLYNCVAFNQNITIAATVTTVGNEFMQNCNAMVNTVTIYTDPTNFKTAGTTSLTLATDDKNALCFKTGITIVCSTSEAKTAFRSIFKDLDDQTNNNYRTLL